MYFSPLYIIYVTVNIQLYANTRDEITDLSFKEKKSRVC